MSTDQQPSTVIEGGKIPDYVTNRPLKDAPKEQVRQRIERALFHEYGISVEDMQPDFKLKVNGKNKKLDIAIFEHGAAHTPENLRQVVICQKEPSQGRKGAVKLRTHDEAEKEFAFLFDDSDQIKLSDRVLAFMVSELAKYDFTRTAVDAKGAAYQEIVGANLRGNRGQYFTPRGAIKLLVEMLDPQPHERVLDPACGTGGFLVGTTDHMNQRFRAERKIPPDQESTADFLSVHEQLVAYTQANLFGADFDPFLVRAAQMNVVMGANTEGHLFNMNSLEYPNGHLPGLKAARQKADLGAMDVVMTNPPFGSDIPITDPQILKHYDLAQVWERSDDGGFRSTGRLQNSVAPEVLFIERCVEWLKPGGRMGIVLPDGILGNPGDEYIRWWILRHCWVLASVDLPVEVFIVEANVNILTSLLFLKKKTEREIQAEDLGNQSDYPVFMAVAEKVGFDRRGNTLYKRSPDGEELLQEEEEKETIRIRGENVTRTLRRKKKIVDDDLPRIAEAYKEFRAENSEPGKGT